MFTGNQRFCFKFKDFDNENEPKWVGTKSFN